jgi:hypothetical protein
MKYQDIVFQLYFFFRNKVKIWTLSLQQEWLKGTLYVLALGMARGGLKDCLNSI